MNRGIYLNQIFDEGLGKTIYFPIKKIIDKKIKKESINNIITLIVKVLYILLAISLCTLYLYYNWF